jgi:hypothetical protein
MANNLSGVLAALFIFLFLNTFSQPVIKRGESGGWILSSNGKKISGTYDTIYDFDKSGKVCMGCFKRRTQLPNKLIKVYSTTYSCNYLNNKGVRLQIKTPSNDTCSVFGLTKTSVTDKDADELFPVSVSNRRYLVNRDFRQLTFGGHNDIHGSGFDGLYIAEELNASETPMSGVINSNEITVIPLKYSTVKVNTDDSLIIGCTAGVKINGEDDIFSVKGQRRSSFRKHIHLATRSFAVLKLFEPEEKFFVYNFNTQVESPLAADEVKLYRDQNIMIRLKRDWYLYDIVTEKKSFFKSSKDEKN